jgi:hypothetical protein
MKRTLTLVFAVAVFTLAIVYGCSKSKPAHDPYFGATKAAVVVDPPPSSSASGK